jgi:hypothetical protein
MHIYIYVYTYIHICTYIHIHMYMLKCVLEASPPATEETGAMDREIESRQGIGW